MSMARVAALVRARTAHQGTPRLVAITGSVAVGKSTFAHALAAELAEQGGERVEVVATDGFLRSEQELAGVGLLERKGFPESYDVARFAAFLREAASGAPMLRVPVYSHRTRAADEQRDFALPGYLLLEGVYVAQPIREAGLSAYIIFLDAEQGAVRDWYFVRRRALRDAAADHVALDALAQRAWDQINVPNYAEHIVHERVSADLVVIKGADHALLAVHEQR